MSRDEIFNLVLIILMIILLIIYSVYVMIVDCELKQYGKFDWMYENLNSRIDNLQKTKKR